MLEAVREERLESAKEMIRGKWQEISWVHSVLCAVEEGMIRVWTHIDESDPKFSLAEMHEKVCKLEADIIKAFPDLLIDFHIRWHTKEENKNFVEHCKDAEKIYERS